jgi:DNA-binding GntR family transcriptional regulator
MARLQRNVLSDQVRDHLLHAILTGRYPPGSRIVETTVASELGVSQAPVREALRDLEAVGTVEIVAFKGARVRRMDRAELAEAYGVRAELESYGARLALPLISEDDVESLQTLIERMKRAASRHDTLTEAQIDGAFHGRMLEIAQNATLSRLWGNLEPMSRTNITFAVRGLGPLEIEDLHQPILDALKQGDAEAVSQAIRRHFVIASQILDVQFAAAALAGTPLTLQSNGHGPRVAGRAAIAPRSRR